VEEAKLLKFFTSSEKRRLLERMPFPEGYGRVAFFPKNLYDLNSGESAQEEDCLWKGQAISGGLG